MSKAIRPRGRLPAPVAALVVVVLAAGCGASRTVRPPVVAAASSRSEVVRYSTRRTAAASAQPAAPLSVQAAVPIAVGRPASRTLPATGWDLSFDVRLSPGSRLAVDLGYGHQALMLTRGQRGPVTISVSGQSHHLADWMEAGAAHVEATANRFAVNGTGLAVTSSRTHRLVLSLRRGQASIQALLVSPAADRAALLLHRVLELQARIPLGRFPLGADASDRLYFDNRYWTNGFWAGALWQGAAVAGAPFDRWALAVTVRHFGYERTPTHDVGFMYGQSSLLAWQHLCRDGAAVGSRAPAALCRRLRASVLAAADELLRLAATNRAAGTIPTGPGGPRATTIIDSMMNLGILTWASQVTGRSLYARAASRHAHRVAALLVRADGSTAQAVQFDRATGAVRSIGTHQGLSATSTWSRGQAWALYGFAQTAAALHDRSLLRIALRVAAYTSRHLKPGQIPPWDYDAPAGAPVDVSAGAVAAAGYERLAAACRTMPAGCSGAAGLAESGRRLLGAVLEHASTQPPLGFLAPQILNEHGGACWCNRGELIFGLSYALEAVALERSAGE